MKSGASAVMWDSTYCIVRFNDGRNGLYSVSPDEAKAIVAAGAGEVVDLLQTKQVMFVKPKRGKRK